MHSDVSHRPGRQASSSTQTRHINVEGFNLKQQFVWASFHPTAMTSANAALNKTLEAVERIDGCLSQIKHIYRKQGPWNANRAPSHRASTS
jgi:hypothetical protein